jgi:hypothetical protein
MADNSISAISSQLPSTLLCTLPYKLLYAPSLCHANCTSFYSITMKTEYEPKKVSLTVDVTALVTKEDSPGRSALLGLSLPLQHL